MTMMGLVFGGIWIFIFLSVVLSCLFWPDKSPKSEDNDDLWNQI